MRVLLARLLALSLLITISGTAGAQSQQQPLKAEELDQLVAPIALYPDTLLAEVLMASTYPLEVVEASRWADENKSLKGEQLKSAADKQTWDDSVKSLTATPSVLSMMSTKLSWTQKLGDAVLAQQPDVMDAVQRLRGKAQAQNKLQTTKQQKVSVATQQNKQVIVIEPTEPNTIYVPYYDPGVVYGAWPYAAYPPYYFPPPGYIPGAAIATGLAFGAGIAVGAWAANNNFWGGGVNWGGNNININRNTNINSNNNWSHNADHRHGVRYNNADVANKFGKGGNARGNAQNRMDFRGRDGQQVLKPGGDRPGAGNRPGGGDRPGAGNRPGGGDRPSAGNRPGGGDRGNAGNRGGGQRPSGGGRDNAFSHAGGAGAARAQSNRGHASMGGGGGGARMGGGGGGFSGGGGGGARMGGGGGGGRGGGGGGGRRSDANLKHDVVLLGHLDNGLSFYRFSYNGSEKAYVGVIAQEVQAVAPDAVTRGSDGYLRVRYDKLGLKFQTYDQWLGSGASVPAAVRVH